MERALATIRKISEVKVHPNADKLELAMIDGWQCVVIKGQFKTDDLIVYCEIDSFIPTEIAPYLTKSGKEPKEFEGIKGERLKTIKLRQELSQGLVLSRDVLTRPFEESDLEEISLMEGTDVTELLGIKKWERPVNANLAGNARGNFPEFIRKTDQERIQNIFHKLTAQQVIDKYEGTLKVDGSSCTFYYNNGEVGVCSRNQELKIDDSNLNNSFVKMFVSLGIGDKLIALGRNIAIQGELYGHGINGNWEGISEHRFAVFDIWDIDKQEYLPVYERCEIVAGMKLDHVPYLGCTTLEQFNSVKDFLYYAERPSINNKIAEGVVFKSLTNPNFSFKVISNEYLVKGEG